MSAPSKRSWRKPREGAVARDNGAADQRANWQSRELPGGNRSSIPGWMKLAGLGILAAALAGLYVAFLLFAERQVPMIEVVVTRYQAAIAPNAFAREDVERLQGANGRNVRHLPDKFQGDVTWHGKNKLLEHLGEALQNERPGGPRGDALVVYLSTHGALNGDAEPCLLLSDAQPLDDGTWLPLADLLETIKRNAPADARKVVLILDTARLPVDWRLGHLQQGFNDRLQATVKQANVPQLYLLSAAGTGETAWAAPELGGTVFGHFVADGVDGRADEQTHGGNGNSEVSLRELHGFVHKNVSQWVRTNRADRQQPMLVVPEGGDADFPLISLSRGPELPARPPTTPISKQIKDRYQEIGDLWQRFARQTERYDLVRINPLSVAVLQNKLLRLEQLAVAGHEYNAAFDEELGQARFEIEAELPPGRPDIAAYSVPLAQRQTADPAEQEVQTAQYLEAWRSAGGLPQAAEGEPPLPKQDYLTTLRAALAWLGESPLSAQRVDVALRAVDDVQRIERETGLALPHTVEVQYLGLLRRQLEWENPALLALAPEAAMAAMKTRQLSETAAAPDDDRVHYFVQAQVGAGDRQRRMAEDRLLGDEGPVGQALGMFNTLSGEEGAYAQARKRAQRLEELLRQRDRAWADAPHLADWLLAHAQRGEAASRLTATATLHGALRRLIEGNRRLAAALDSLQPTGGVFDLSAAEDGYATVRDAHQLLQREFEEVCIYLDETPSADADSLRRLTRVLRSPLVPAEIRGILLQKRAACLFARAGRLEHLRESESDAQHAAEPEADANGMPDWPRHPALELLERSDLPLLSDLRQAADEESRLDDEIAWLARQGRIVRRRVKDVLEDTNSLEAVSDARLVRGDEPLNTRAGLSEADRLARAAAPFTAGRLWDQPSKDPVHRLRRIDQQFLMLWHGRRILDDFYARAPNEAERQYFAAVAEGCFKAARQLHEAPRVLAHDGEHLTALLQRRLDAAENVSIAASDLRIDSASQSAPQILRLALPDGLPAGETSIRLLLPDGSLLPFRETGGDGLHHRILQGVAAGDANLELQIPLENAPETLDRLTALLRYRGHEIRAPFTLRRPNRVATTVITAPPPLDTEVLVRGDSRQRAYVMIVLDCSGTMLEGSRMENAKTALDRTLALLAKHENYNVGLRVFGRRARWLSGERDPKFIGEVPEADRLTLTPDIDTERLVEPKPLNEEQLKKLSDTFPILKPYGATPLYHALQTSLAAAGSDFVDAGPDDPKHIVLITDGVNNVRATDTSSAHVRRARSDKHPHARISIVFIDRHAIEADDAGRRRIEELRELATFTGGTFHDASDTESLATELRNVLKLAKFSVSEVGDTAPAAAEQHELGSTAHVKVESPPQALRVDAHGVDRIKPVELKAEGGERFVLELDKESDTHRLFFPRYDPYEFNKEDDARGPPVQVADGELTLQVCPLMPLRRAANRGEVEFRVYVENLKDSAYTPRPKHLWAEIRPLKQSGQEMGRTYHFYDVDLVPRRPVPVLRFVVGDWPEDAPRAEIRLWLTTADSVPKGREIEVQSDGVLTFGLDGREDRFSVERQARGTSGEGIQVVVNEERTRVDPDQLCRIQIWPQPARIEHRLSEYPEAEVLRHTFEFERTIPTKVLVTPRSSILEAAAEVPPLVVRVPD
jgi:Mg-chelatase subunit ChlD